MTKRDAITRFLPEYSSIGRKATDEDFYDGWYLPLAHVFALIMEYGPSNPDFLSRVSDFIEWALASDETLSTAATIELLEPLLYGQYGAVGPLLEMRLGSAALEYLSCQRASHSEEREQ